MTLRAELDPADPAWPPQRSGREGRGPLRSLLEEAGALRLLGLRLSGPDELGPWLEELLGPLRSYAGGVGYKTEQAPGVYTASDLPGPLSLLPHHELSYTARPPRWIAFWCPRPADRGGETPILCGALLRRRLPEELVERWRARPLRYRRWYGPPTRRSAWLNRGQARVMTWPLAFETADPDEALRRAGELGLEARWEREGLSTSIALPALRPHPKGEVWYNQGHAFALGGEALAGLRGLVGMQQVGVEFADGAPLPPADLAQIQTALLRHQRVLPWASGELRLLDNHRVMHGRRPYTGPRKVLVAMAGL